MNENTRKYMAFGSIGLGVINLCAWFLPICGGPLSLIGIVLGILGIKSEQRILAIIGIVLSGLGLLASIVNALIGVSLALQNGGLLN